MVSFTNTILCGDAVECLRDIPDKSINMCVTSPPYFRMRDYGVEGQIGTEQCPELYINRLMQVVNEVYRVLRDVVGKETVSWLCIVLAAPFAAAGFFQYNGMTLEQFIITVQSVLCRRVV